MELLFKEIKQIITSDFIAESSRKLIIDEAILANLSDSIIAGVLGALLAKGDSPATEEILSNFVSHIDKNEEIKVFFFDEQTDSRKIDAAKGWESAVFSGKRRNFISLLSQPPGISEVNVEKLMVTITYVSALYLGRKLLTEEYSITGLLGQIHAERNFFLGHIPFGLTLLLELPSLLALGQNLSSDAKVVSDAVYYEIMHGNTPVKKKKTGLFKLFSFRASL